MCSAFALITGGLQAATPVLLPNVIYLALWPHSEVDMSINLLWTQSPPKDQDSMNGEMVCHACHDSTLIQIK
jgi:hypothetical protein